MQAKKVKQLSIWWLVFIVMLTPFAYTVFQIVLLQTGGENYLGSEPGKALVDRFGKLALWCLVLTLSVSTLKRRLNVKWLLRFRRQIGLFAFFYASLHLLSYNTFLLQWDWLILLEDLVERPYIYVGTIAWLGLLLLAITSPKWMLKKLKQHWLTLHKAIYLCVLLVLIHEWMQIRASILQVTVHSILLAALLLERFFFWQKKNNRKSLHKS